MLKHETEDAHIPWKHTPPASPVSARFDKDAIQEILETAAHLQKAEQDMLSQDELEAMAAEMGISPRHVRRAIAISGRHTGTVVRRTPLRLSARQLQIVLTTTLLYVFANTYLFGYLESARQWAGPFQLYLVSIFAVPWLLSFWLGLQVRSKRLGAACGAFLTFFMFLGMQIILAAVRHDSLFVNDGGWIVFLIVCCAIISGIGGAAGHQWLANRKIGSVTVAERPSDRDR